MADFRPVEGTKARIINIRPGPADTSLDGANAEWIEIRVELDSDLANWRIAHLRALWREDVAKPVESEWVYTFGAPHFAVTGEVYRIHSGSIVRAAMHPLADDLTPGRKHVYASGPLRAARLMWKKGDYAQLVDAFGTIVDEVVVWPEARAEPKKEPAQR